MMNIEDQIAITQLLNLYGHILDERAWTRMNELFVDDLLFDGSDVGGKPIRGLDALVARFREPQMSHPLAHHASNIVIWRDAAGVVRAASKGYGPRPDPAASRTVTYKDVLRETPQGWRIAERHVIAMRPRPND